MYQQSLLAKLLIICSIYHNNFAKNNCSIRNPFECDTTLAQEKIEPQIKISTQRSATIKEITSNERIIYQISDTEKVLCKTTYMPETFDFWRNLLFNKYNKKFKAVCRQLRDEFVTTCMRLSYQSEKSLIEFCQAYENICFDVPMEDSINRKIPSFVSYFRFNLLFIKY